MTGCRDDDLAGLFRDERLDDRRRTPGFDAVLASRRAPGRRRPALRLAAAAVLGTAAVLVWRLAGPSPASPPFEFRAGDLRVPTDFLLELTGSGGAGLVPRIGEVDWYPLDAGVPPGGAETGEPAGRSDRS
jgi:hypothetical protein